MSTINLFKLTLDSFFTKAHCNDSLKNENDFQEKVAQHLSQNGFYVLREVHIKKEDLPEICEKLNQEYIIIDIVAYKDGYFFPLELKFENDNEQTRHVTKETYFEDRKRMRVIYKTFNDIPVARTRILTNCKTLRDSMGDDSNWHELLDGERGDTEFMWQWHWWVDQPRNSKESFAPLWDKTVNTRVPNRGKKGDTLFTIAAIKEKEAIHNIEKRLTNR